MKKENQNVLIEKYLLGKTSDEEREALEKWKNSSLDAQKSFEEISKISALTRKIDFDVNPQTDTEWASLQSKIQSQTGRTVPMKKTFQWWKVAASIAILLGIGWFISNHLSPDDFNTMYATGKGEIRQIRLADGSNIFLNSDSELWVDDGFNTDDRKVKLIGEAHFSVAKNVNAPFLIETGDVTTRVIGTAFNLAAYPDQTTVSIHVDEGIVSFEDAHNTLKLTANDAAIFDNNKNILQKTTYIPTAKNWMKGEIVFDNTALSEVIPVLERKFNVEIIDKSSHGDQLYTDKISAEDTIDSVLERLGIVLKLEILKEANSYVLKDKK